MANTSSESLSPTVHDPRANEPRTFFRDEIISVDELSPRTPYLSFHIGHNPLRRLIIKIWSHDQGWCDAEYRTDQPYANSHTWFALGIVPKSTNPFRTPDEPYLCEIQRNVRASTQKKCHILEWRLNTPCEEDHSDKNEAQRWLESISSGSSIEVGVFPLARYAGWVNVVHRVEVELYDNSDKTPSLPVTGPIVGGVIPRTRDASNAASQIINKSYVGTEAASPLIRRIEEAQAVLDPCSYDQIGAALHNHAFGLNKLYKQTGSIGDLTRVIEATQKAIYATPANHPIFAASLSDLGGFFLSRYYLTASRYDLMRAIEVTQKAAETASDDHPDCAGILNNLGHRLVLRHGLTQSKEDLTRAIELVQEAIRLTPRSHSNLNIYLRNHGRWLYMQYGQTRSMDDLSTSIEVTEQAIEVTRDGDPDLTLYLEHLAARLGTRYQHTGSIEDLNRQIQVVQKIIELTSNDHPELSKFLGGLAKQFNDRYKHTGRIDDLESSVEVLERAVKTIPDTHPGRARHILHLGAQLHETYKTTNSMKTLERAIEVMKMAIEIIPDSDHETLAKYLSRLGNCLGDRSEQTNLLDDLDLAIEHLNRAIAISPKDHPDLAWLYNSLGQTFAQKSDLIGSTDMLTRAIEFNQKAIKATHHNDIGFMNLGGSLARRYYQTGSIDDLTNAIEAFQNAVRAAESSPQGLHRALSNLSICFEIRYDRIGLEDDLTKSIEAGEKAINVSPQKDIALAATMANQGMVLLKKYKHTGAMEDLARAIELSEQAFRKDRSRPLAVCFHALRVTLSDRFRRTGSMDDLMRATNAAQKAVEATPRGHSGRANNLLGLGNVLGLLYSHTHAKADEDAQLSAYIRAWDCTTSIPSDRIRSANYAAKIHASRKEWDKAYHLLQGAVLLLPKVTPRSLKQLDIQRILSYSPSLARDAAAIAINAGKSASQVLSILESGRGVIAGLSINTRGDLSDLMGTCPSLAGRFIALRKELDSHSNNSDPLVEISTVNRRHHASREFDEVIEEIRAQEGFHNFLQPPSTESLMTAARPGPIAVINVSQYRCDAILVESETVRLLELTDLTDKGIPEYANHSSKFKHDPWRALEWLWTTICRPCLDALGFTEALGEDAQWPHIWWIPTGVFSLMHLHAAGIYKPGSRNTVLDRVVSSYASSIKALQYGRQRRGGSIEHEQHNTAILIAMEDTKGQTSLPNAKTEVDKVRALCPKIHLKVFTPLPRKSDILDHLQDCNILHFAGHAESAKDPSQSCLLLGDEETLTVNDIRESWLQRSPAFLAYLSACSTGSYQDGLLSDENIHLVSAFQLAGFQHVIGTLWEASDPHCADVASSLYETLCEDGLTDEAVSYGLHHAVRKLRDNSSWGGTRRAAERVDKTPAGELSLSTYWIPFIHFGV